MNHRTVAPTRFTNLYFKDLLKRTWTPRQWNGPHQFEDESKKLMMLPTDIALLTDDIFKPWVQQYASDQALFFRHFSAAFTKLLELGLSPHGQRALAATGCPFLNSKL